MDVPTTGLQTTWFILITILWAGFFVLEGFDFGVGMVTPFVGRDVGERGVLKETTGPFWDGNEVWLITAGGATFAAFPLWYASLFSSYYLPLFVVLVALILRATGTEYRDRRDSERWRTVWDRVIAVCCLLVPLLIGVAFGGLLNGIPLNADGDFTGSFVSLVQPFALLTGLLFVGLCLLQGLVFLRLKTTGALAVRAGALSRPVAVAVVALVAIHMVWQEIVADTGVIPGLGAWLALTFAVAAAWLAFEHAYEGWAFVCSTATIVFTVIDLFATLYPDLLVSTTSSDYTLTVADSSGSYTLTLMTIVAAVMLPVVLLYTAWNYWVFRARVTGPVVGSEPPTGSAPDPAGGAATGAARSGTDRPADATATD